MSSPLSTEQWFLDLDGVRSGPYQTPEILNLIAEGEVMPHHRISTSLKTQNWISVLDWRLDQAKKINPFQSAEVREQRHFEQEPLPEEDLETLTEELKGEFIPLSSYQAPLPEPEPEPAPQPRLQTTKSPVTTPPARVVTPPPMTPKLPSFLTEPDLEPIPETVEPKEPAPEPAPIPKIEPFKERKEHKIEALAPAEVPTLDATPSPMPAEKPKVLGEQKKRDAAAEMFDLIQTTKHKREQKSQSLAQQASQHEIIAATAKTKSGFGWTKTAATGALIILLGFGLGQLFQQHSGVPEKTAADKSAAAVSASPATAATTTTPPPEPEVIDRSTDKMVIRSRVDHREAQAQVKAKDKPTKPAAEKELQELKDLKKELQELKALKDELKNNPGEIPGDAQYQDEDPNGQGTIDPGYNYNPQGGYPPPQQNYNNGYPPIKGNNQNPQYNH